MRTPLEVKICGITRRNDAVFAAELGADYLGFVLAPGSPRFVPPERLPELARGLPEGCRSVAVMVNPSRDEILRAAETVDLIQLHGSEPPELIGALPGIRFWKAVHLASREEIAMLSNYPAERFVLDAAFGGSGTPCDWGLAAEAARWRPAMLAGGISPDNVAGAVAEVAPAGVDASSSLESAPGVKSKERMIEFFLKIKELRK